MDFFGVRPSKGLGQNFLNDFSVVQEIVYSAGLTKEDLVIEVGPGLGAMTGRLAESAGQVLAVEIDRSLIPPLQAVCMEHGNIELIEGDILKLDIRSIAAERIAASGGALKRVKVVANLPYYITTPIILSFPGARIAAAYFHDVHGAEGGCPADDSAAGGKGIRRADGCGRLFF